jgi:hypothetical protein
MRLSYLQSLCIECFIYAVVQYYSISRVTFTETSHEVVGSPEGGKNASLCSGIMLKALTFQWNK